MRAERKKEHIENYLRTTYQNNTLFDNIYIEHFATTEVNFAEIDTSVDFLGKKLSFPLLIDGMTGGTEIAYDINEDLARLSKTFNVAFEVGSQKVALENSEFEDSFLVIRDVLSESNVVISNLSALASVDEAKKAIEMLNADAISLHLNSAQEMVQIDGDRDFSGILNNIEKIASNLNVPVIVKETGCGIDKKSCKRLLDIGVKYIDTGGAGGSNFVEIEDLRRNDVDFTHIYYWGVPTAKSIIDCRAVSGDFTLIGSGGIKNGDDIVKALILGSDLVGIAGEILKFLMHGGYSSAEYYLRSIIYQTKMIMTLLGVKSIEELRRVDYKIFGKLKDIL